MSTQHSIFTYSTITELKDVLTTLLYLHREKQETEEQSNGHKDDDGGEVIDCEPSGKEVPLEKSSYFKIRRYPKVKHPQKMRFKNDTFPSSDVLERRKELVFVIYFHISSHKNRSRKLARICNRKFSNIVFIPLNISQDKRLCEYLPKFIIPCMMATKDMNKMEFCPATKDSHIYFKLAQWNSAATDDPAPWGIRTIGWTDLRNILSSKPIGSPTYSWLFLLNYLRRLTEGVIIGDVPCFLRPEAIKKTFSDQQELILRILQNIGYYRGDPIATTNMDRRYLYYLLAYMDGVYAPIFNETPYFMSRADKISQMKETEIFKDFKALLSTFNDRQLMADVRRIIPLKRLQKDAVNYSILSRDSHNLAIPTEISLLYALSKWVRDRFTLFIDIQCLHCNSSDPLKQIEPKYNILNNGNHLMGEETSYICLRCGNESIVVRENDPLKILENRFGRCRELIFSFALCAAALGYSVRLVYGEFKHMWLEVNSSIRKMWIPVDPCEDSIDQPTIYHLNLHIPMREIFAMNPGKFSMECLTEKYLHDEIERRIDFQNTKSSREILLMLKSHIQISQLLRRCQKGIDEVKILQIIRDFNYLSSYSFVKEQNKNLWKTVSRDDTMKRLNRAYITIEAIRMSLIVQYGLYCMVQLDGNVKRFEYEYYIEYDNWTIRWIFNNGRVKTMKVHGLETSIYTSGNIKRHVGMYNEECYLCRISLNSQGDIGWKFQALPGYHISRIRCFTNCKVAKGEEMKLFCESSVNVNEIGCQTYTNTKKKCQSLLDREFLQYLGSLYCYDLPISKIERCEYAYIFAFIISKENNLNECTKFMLRKNIFNNEKKFPSIKIEVTFGMN